MSEKTETLFSAIFNLEDIREILRETAPNHEFNEEEKDAILKSISKTRKNLDKLEELL